MIKFNKILLGLFLISFGSGVSAMDHGDICMSSFYYKNDASVYYKHDVSEKAQAVNHKPFSDKNNNESSYVVRTVSAAFLKSVSSEKLQELKSQK